MKDGLSNSVDGVPTWFDLALVHRWDAGGGAVWKTACGHLTKTAKKKVRAAAAEDLKCLECYPKNEEKMISEWPADVLDVLRKTRFSYMLETELQKQIANAFRAAGIVFEREYQLTGQDRIDFMLPDAGHAYGLGVEVKIGRNAPLASILRQLKRYTDNPRVNKILVVSSRPLNLPATLTDKPLMNVSLHNSAF